MIEIFPFLQSRPSYLYCNKKYNARTYSVNSTLLKAEYNTQFYKQSKKLSVFTLEILSPLKM